MPKNLLRKKKKKTTAKRVHQKTQYQLYKTGETRCLGFVVTVKPDLKCFCVFICYKKQNKTGYSVHKND